MEVKKEKRKKKVETEIETVTGVFKAIAGIVQAAVNLSSLIKQKRKKVLIFYFCGSVHRNKNQNKLLLLRNNDTPTCSTLLAPNQYRAQKIFALIFDF